MEVINQYELNGQPFNLAGNRPFWGATDVASALCAITGEPTYRTLYEIVEGKLGRAPEKVTTMAMRRGTTFEDYVKELYEEKTKTVLVKAERLAHPHHPFLAASPDFVTPDFSKLVQTKTHSKYLRAHYGEEGTDDLPAYEVYQALWETHIARLHGWDLTVNDVAVSFGWEELNVHPVLFNGDVAIQMEAAILDIIDKYIVRGEPCPVEAADTEFLTRQYALVSPTQGRECEATEEVNEAIAVIQKLYPEAGEVKRKIEDAKNVIRAFLLKHDATVLHHQLGKPVTWKAPKGSPKWKSVAEAMGATADVIAQHTPVLGAPRLLGPWKDE